MTRLPDGPNPDAHAVPGVRIGVLGAPSEAAAPEGRVARLKKRAEFLACAKGRKQHQRNFVLQARRRDEIDPSVEPELARVGFTVTKKTGNSVVRNRIRRRLREAIRLAGASAPKPGGASAPQPGYDYVLIGRREALAATFAQLRGEVEHAFRKISSAGRPDARAARPPKDL